MKASKGQLKGAKDDLRSLKTPSKAKIGRFGNIAAAAGACDAIGIERKCIFAAKKTHFYNNLERSQGAEMEHILRLVLWMLIYYLEGRRR